MFHLIRNELMVQDDEPLGPPGRHQDEPVTLEEPLEDLPLGARALHPDHLPEGRMPETRLPSALLWKLYDERT